METVLPILSALGIGGVIGWWLTQRFGLEITHGHRVIEEHTKKLHEYVEKYYLKHITWAEALAQKLEIIANNIGQNRTPNQGDLELCLYSWARLAKHEEEWAHNASFILLLRDLTGERVVSRLNFRKEEVFLEVTTLTPIDEAEIRQNVAVNESVPQFLGRVRAGGALKNIYDRYTLAIQRSGQLDTIRQLAAHLHCLAALFSFEVNMCYRAWYGNGPSRPSFTPEQAALVNANLRQMVVEGSIKNDDMEAYQERIGLLRST